ncbi:MAG: prepilin-type N-terminal cleavage/methylation domain-containing protein, partial [Chthoniobacterales bacterium]
MNSTPQFCKRSGFSIMELLAVMAIMGMLMVLAGPAFQALSSSKNMSNSVYGITGLLEFARNEAQTRRTYTWVAFGGPKTNGTNTSGNYDLCVVIGSSLDSSFTNTNATNIALISKIFRFENVILTNDTFSTNINTNTSITSANVLAGPYTVLSTNLINSNLSLVFTNRITFTPSGQAILSGGGGTNNSASTPYTDAIAITMVGARGTKPT